MGVFGRDHRMPSPAGASTARRPFVGALVGALLVVSAAAAGCSSSGTDEPAPSTVDPAQSADGTDASASSTTAGGTAAPATTESPAATTAAPATAPTTAPTVAPSTDAAGVYDFSAIGPLVQQFVDERGLNGAGLVVVDRVDGVVHEQYWGAFTADRVSLIASASKMIVAGVLMRLDDQGLLDVDAPVADAVEWGAGNPDVTPAQLVSNSSGLVGLAPIPGYGPYICQYRTQGSLADCGATIFTTPDDDADVIAPDTEFRYGGGQWQVAGAVAEAVSGRSWPDLVRETYIEPCGVDSLGFNNHWIQFGSIGFAYPTEFAGDPSTLAATANPNMEGGAFITAADYAQLLLMHLRDGRCGDEQVLSAEALDAMHADRVGDVYGDADRGGGYGMGWWVDRATQRITDPGAYGAVPWLDLEDGHGAYLVVEARGSDGAALAGLLFDPVAEAVSVGRR